MGVRPRPWPRPYRAVAEGALEAPTPRTDDHMDLVASFAEGLLGGHVDGGRSALEARPADLETSDGQMRVGPPMASTTSRRETRVRVESIATVESKCGRLPQPGQRTR